MAWLGQNAGIRRAAYETVTVALVDLDAIEQLHKDEMIGCDAAVIDKETGKPHCRRMDRHIRAVAVSGVIIRGGFPHRLHSTVMTF